MHTQFLTAFLPWHREAHSQKATGWASLAVCVLAGSSGVTFAAALTGALSPLSMLFISEGLTLVFTILSFGLFPILRRLHRIRRELWSPMILVGLCSSVIAPLLAFTGLRSTGPINSELFMRMEDIFLVLFAVALLRERLHGRQILGGGCVLLGAAFVGLRGFTETITLAYGDLLIIISALVWACGSVIYKKFLHHIEPELMIFMRTLTALTVFFLVSPFLRHTLLDELHQFPGELIGALIGYAFLARYLNLFTFYEALDRLPVHVVSMFMNTGIIVSIAFSRLYLGTPIHSYHVIGALCILIGCILMETKQTKRWMKHRGVLLQHRHRNRL